MNILGYMKYIGVYGCVWGYEEVHRVNGGRIEFEFIEITPLLGGKGERRESRAGGGEREGERGRVEERRVGERRVKEGPY